MFLSISSSSIIGNDFIKIIVIDRQRNMNDSILEPLFCVSILSEADQYNSLTIKKNGEVFPYEIDSVLKQPSKGRIFTGQCLLEGYASRELMPSARKAKY
jgi:hypothetical protein